MKARQMGLAGVRVSEIGLGTQQFGRRVDNHGAAAIVDKALDLGINFIDTADSYGDVAGTSEKLLGETLRARRHQFIVATKTGSMHSEPLGRLSRRQIIQRLDESLKRLETDYVDLYYLHFPDPGTSLDESMRALDDLVQSGKIRYAALSNHPAWQVVQAWAICDRRHHSQPVVVQNEYNLLNRNAELELLPACKALGLSLVPYWPLAEGFLTGKYSQGKPVPTNVRGHGNAHFQEMWLTQSYFEALAHYERFAKERNHATSDLAIAWLLANPTVCSVITGVTTPEQLEMNVNASDWKLEVADLAALQPH